MNCGLCLLLLILLVNPDGIISVDFENAPLPTIITDIADQGGNNIMLGNSVKGTLTIKMFDRPWREILHTVLVMSGYEYHEYGDVIFVDTPEKFREGISRNHILSAYKIKALDLDHVVNFASTFLTKEGWVLPDERTNQVLVFDTPEVQKIVAEYLKENDTGVTQVIVDVKSILVTAELNEAIEQRWHFPILIWPVFNADVLLNTDVPLAGYLEGKIYAVDNEELYVMLSMFSEAKQGNEIAGGMLRVQNNYEGAVMTGQRFGVTLRDPAGNAMVQFFTSGFKLRVVPHVVDLNMIKLSIRFEYSSLDRASALAGVPIINTFNTEAELFLKNGETGIITRQIYMDLARRQSNPCWLSVPLINWFFRPWSRTNARGYQYVLVTPTITS